MGGLRSCCRRSPGTLRRDTQNRKSDEYLRANPKVPINYKELELKIASASRQPGARSAARLLPWQGRLGSCSHRHIGLTGWSLRGVTRLFPGVCPTFLLIHTSWLLKQQCLSLDGRSAAGRPQHSCDCLFRLFLSQAE
jgi:hypothetical protein